MGAAAVPTAATGERVFQRKHLRPALLCSVAVLGAVLYGYDGTYFTGILGQRGFNADFATDGSGQLSSAQQSLLTSLVQAGEVVGCVLAALIGDRAGRKGVFAAAATFVAAGAIFQLSTSSSVPVFATGRALLGVGIGNVANSTPLYLSEIAPTPIRSIAVSCWQLLLAIGQVIGACVNQGTKDIGSTAAYRIPIGLNLAIVLAIFAGLLVLPESPRWLLQHARDDDALAALRRINGGVPDTERIVQREYKLFLQAKHDEDALRAAAGPNATGWAATFRGVELRKFVCTFGILVAQQISGVQFIFSYTTTFLSAVGIDDPFLITIIVDIIEVVGVLCSFLVVNRFGRRPLLLWSSVPMVISLLVVGGLGTIAAAQRSQTQNRTIAAMICIYVFFFNLVWGPLAWVIASEVSTGPNKNKHLGVGTAGFFIVAWAVTFTLPYLFTNAGLGPMIGFIYGGGALLAMLFVYFVIPETKGRSLEEISEMMDARLPTRKWEGYVVEKVVGPHAAHTDDSTDAASDATPESHADGDARKSPKSADHPLTDAGRSDTTRTDLRDA